MLAVALVSQCKRQWAIGFASLSFVVSGWWSQEKRGGDRYGRWHRRQRE